MKKLLTTLIALTVVIATPAFAQSFDPDNGTGNIVQPFGSKPTAPLINKITIRHSGTRAYAMVRRSRSAHLRR